MNKSKNIGRPMLIIVIPVLMLTLITLVTFAADPTPPQAHLEFDGESNYVQVPNSSDFSISPTGALTVSVWMRPDTLEFPRTEGCGFVHWLGKGGTGQSEWVLRMYRVDATGCPDSRPNRISFYVFNFGPPPMRGCGVAFQDPLEAGQWIHVVGVVDHGSEVEGNRMIHIYKNGELRRSFFYGNEITPQHGAVPLRMGTREYPLNPNASRFQGALAEARIWNRALGEAEVAALYQSNIVPQEGLVAEYLLNDSRFVSGRAVEGFVSANWGSDSNPVINTAIGTTHSGC
jgi:hypothetical protein